MRSILDKIQALEPHQPLTKRLFLKEKRIMFADPQTVTVSGVGKTLNRTSTTEKGAKYATSDRAYQLLLEHNYGRRTRHTVRLQHDSLVANPLVSGQNINQSVTCGLWLDIPPGYDTASIVADMVGLLSNLTASTNANLTKLAGGES